MAKERFLLSHKILNKGIEVDKEIIKVMNKLSTLVPVKGIQRFIGYADFFAGS